MTYMCLCFRSFRSPGRSGWLYRVVAYFARGASLVFKQYLLVLSLAVSNITQINVYHTRLSSVTFVLRYVFGFVADPAFAYSQFPRASTGLLSPPAAAALAAAMLAAAVAAAVAALGALAVLVVLADVTVATTAVLAPAPVAAVDLRSADRSVNRARGPPGRASSGGDYSALHSSIPILIEFKTHCMAHYITHIALHLTRTRKNKYRLPPSFIKVNPVENYHWSRPPHTRAND